MDDASESSLARRRIPIDFLTQILLVVLFAATREWAFATAFAFFALADWTRWRQGRARVPVVLACIAAAYAVIVAHLVLKWI